MKRDEYVRLKHIVADALSRPDAERSAYIIAQCGADATARTEVESLLAAAIRAAALYENPALLVAGSRITVEVLDAIEDITVPFAPAPSITFPSISAAAGFDGTDRYAVRRRIGAGGMGVVYEVDDRVRGQVVALKTLRRSSGGDIYQLKREFRNLADVAHPNLVSLYDLVIDERHCFFTMELVDGLTFVDYVRHIGAATSRLERARSVLPQLIHGVEELHRRGMRHRDIKPSNVLVTAAGRVMILDFGLTSRLLREGLPGNEFAGTPAYLSPEQCFGRDESTASDWYSVGATLYHALTGRAPFDGPVREVIDRKRMEDPPPAASLVPDIPADLNAVCMALLHRDPSRRMTGRRALERLSLESADLGTTPHAVFVGRQSSLDVLNRAFANAVAGGSASVVIYGPSGIGKSALVQRFVDRRPEGLAVLVVRSRCHEHESIPYKGLDGVIDGVTRHLTTLPDEERSSMLPIDADALATLFPVVRTLGVDAQRERDASDPIVLRQQAFAAFRELIGRLASRSPVVIDIDDFHWADADSIRWLTDLLRPPSPRGLMIVVSFRSEELDSKPFLRTLIERVDIGERLTVPLGPMPDDEVTQLIEALLPADSRGGSAQQRSIARNSGGNPFLVEALARHAAGGARTDGEATLDEMLTRRIDPLPAESGRFLEMLAVCGRPMRASRIFEACGCRGDERPLVARLRAAQLLRNSRSADLVELYHDRIRETLATRVDADTARRIHEVMAGVLTAHDDDDPEALFEHYRAAGRTELAATHAARAAAKAAGVLAFDLAVTFYRHALALQPHSLHRTAWTAGLARALENAGRPVEAAAAYLEAAVQAGSSDEIEWKRKAAELFLIGGQIDRGLAVSDDVLEAVGMRLARGPNTAIASLVCRRLQLRWRGLDFIPRTPSQIPSQDLLRIDAGWAISSGLAMVDPIRAAAFNVRQLLRALDVGDPYRIARAMALEAGFSVVGRGDGLKRSTVFSRRAEALAAGRDQHYVASLTMLWEGIAAFLTGQWKKASQLCGRAATTLREECTGVTWELNMAHNFFLGGLVSQGELREAARHLPGLIGSARERGNFYLELELNTRMILVWLAADDPDGADHRGNAGIARWSHRGFQRQHYSHMLMRVQTELYRGRAREAWQLIEGRQRALRRSRFLRVQHTRIEAANYHARSALAVAAAGGDRDRMVRIVLRDVKRLERENRPWSNGFARLLRATVAHLQGDAAAAVEGLTAAIEAFVSADMRLYASVCQSRLGSLVGGDRGRELRGEADRWMASQEIRNPAAMTRLIAPGFKSRNL